MKKFLLVLVLPFLITLPAHADLSVGVSKKYARAVYSVSLNGGSSTSHALNAQLPAGAVITDLYVYINEKFENSTVSSANSVSSVALQCVGTRDLMEYQDLVQELKNDMYAAKVTETAYGASQMIPISQPASPAGIASVPSNCQVTAVVRGDSGFVPYTSGKLTAIIEYFQP